MSVGFSVSKGLTIPDETVPTSDIIAVLPSASSENALKVVYHVGDVFKASELADIPGKLLEHFPPLVELPSHLTYGKENTHIIICKTAGTGKAQSHYDNILKPLLKQLSIEHQAHTTTSPNSIGALTQELLACKNGQQDHQKLIVLLSGDTTVHEHINSLPDNRHSHYIAVIPLGTGNALANSRHLNYSTLLYGKPCRLPTLTAQFSAGSKFVVNEAKDRTAIPKSTDGKIRIKCVVVCSWGLHASLVAGSDTVAYRKHGNERFSMVASDLLHGKWSNGELHHYHGRLKVFTEDDTALVKGAKDMHTYVLLTLIPRLEKTFNISPHSDTTLYTNKTITSAYMVYIPSVKSEKVFEIFGKVTDGTHIKMPDVGYYKSTGWRVDMQEPDISDNAAPGKGCWRWICVDGRIVEVDEGGFVEVLVDQDEDVSWRLLYREVPE